MHAMKKIATVKSITVEHIEKIMNFTCNSLLVKKTNAFMLIIYMHNIARIDLCIEKYTLSGFMVFLKDSSYTFSFSFAEAISLRNRELLNILASRIGVYSRYFPPLKYIMPRVWNIRKIILNQNTHLAKKKLFLPKTIWNHLENGSKILSNKKLSITFMLMIPPFSSTPGFYTPGLFSCALTLALANARAKKPLLLPSILSLNDLYFNLRTKRAFLIFFQTPISSSFSCNRSFFSMNQSYEDLNHATVISLGRVKVNILVRTMNPPNLETP